MASVIVKIRYLSTGGNFCEARLLSTRRKLWQKSVAMVGAMQQSGTVGNNVKQANERRNLMKDSTERRNSVKIQEGVFS